jgi:hypothetical protein
VTLFVPFDQYVVAASGGHHGLAVAIAGKLLGVSATLCVPRTAPEGKVRRIEVTGTRLVLHGGRCRPRWPQDGRYSPSSKARYEKYLPEPAGSYGEEAPPMALGPFGHVLGAHALREVSVTPLGAGTDPWKPPHR